MGRRARPIRRSLPAGFGGEELRARDPCKPFDRLALDGASGAEVAQELGLSVAAVYVAKSRVLARIREEAAGLID